MTELLQDYDYVLPPDAIAQVPLTPRDSAKMLDCSDRILQDRQVCDLPDILRPGDLVIVNDTRVLRAQLTGYRGIGKIRFTLHKRVSESVWHAFAKPAKKCTPGTEIKFSDDFQATITDKHEDGEVVLSFSCHGDALDDAIDSTGQMPLPPYIKRAEGGDANDTLNYQTMFADKKGAVAAPTAGLHFTPELKDRLLAAGIEFAHVTLHVGAGTFLPVKVDKLSDHKMHSEWGEVSSETAAAINAAKAEGRRILAIGTTAMRILETAYQASNKRGHRLSTQCRELAPFSGETDIFITPGYVFGVCDMLLTNFHLPKSTLLMLVSAFYGFHEVRAAYQHALSHNYRFFSYGDACLLACRTNGEKDG